MIGCCLLIFGPEEDRPRICCPSTMTYCTLRPPFKNASTVLRRSISPVTSLPFNLIHVSNRRLKTIPKRTQRQGYFTQLSALRVSARSSLEQRKTRCELRATKNPSWREGQSCYKVSGYPHLREKISDCPSDNNYRFRILYLSPRKPS